MRQIIIPLTVAFATIVRAADPVPPPRIDTLEALTAYASHLVVKVAPITLPHDAQARKKLIWESYANQPEERAFDGVTTDGWQGKWDLLSNELIRSATAQGLDADSLRLCLERLNRGRNESSGLVPYISTPEPVIAPGTPKEEVLRILQEAKTQRQRAFEEALAQARAHPEKFVDETLATIPVGAYFAQHPEGKCWIIVCKWEHSATNVPALSLGHTRIWAVDAKTLDFLAFESCD